MKLTIEFEREDDGRWIAEVVELPGVMVYGNSRRDALVRVQSLALQVIAEKIAHHEIEPEAVCTFEEEGEAA